MVYSTTIIAQFPAIRATQSAYTDGGRQTMKIVTIKRDYF
jgi:hypothetical protein